MPRYMVTHCAFPREWLSAFLVLNKHQFNTNLTVFHHERLLNINLLLHHDKTLFPSSYKFNPPR